jgi:hypothetical protein
MHTILAYSLYHAYFHMCKTIMDMPPDSKLKVQKPVSEKIIEILQIKRND